MAVAPQDKDADELFFLGDVIEPETDMIDSQTLMKSGACHSQSVAVQ